jgi:hypothetical protein
MWTHSGFRIRQLPSTPIFFPLKVINASRTEAISVTNLDLDARRRNGRRLFTLSREGWRMLLPLTLKGCDEALLLTLQPRLRSMKCCIKAGVAQW